MAEDNPPLLKGTLAVLILKALAWAPMHGFEISAWIEEHSGAAFEVDAAGIYQSLYRMEAQQLVDAEWGILREAATRPVLPAHRQGARATSTG